MMGSFRRAPTAQVCLGLLAFVAAWSWCTVIHALPPDEFRDEPPDRPDGIHVLDGSYVIDAGQLLVNITNHGLIGSQYSAFRPYSNAPSAQWPGGTGDEYLYAAGLWIGGKVGGQIAVSTGQPERELRPGNDLEDTIYEARERQVKRPEMADRATGNRFPDYYPDDDDDGKVDEDFLNGYDDDGDGRIDEDFGQIGDQMLVCTMRDDTRLAQEIYAAHRPLGVSVVQRVSGWYDEDYEDIVALDFEIKNENFNAIEDVYLGFYVDCDIQNRGEAATQPDDLTGFFDGVVRDEFYTFHRVQVGWMKDAHPDAPLPGVLGVITLDHTTDFSQLTAPHITGVRSYQRFTLGATTYQGGEPLNDEDRYLLMSSNRNDPDARVDKPDDYRFMVSCGPFPYVKPGKTLNYRLAMVIGDGMDVMLRTALRASQLQRGRWFNLDGDYGTGSGGWETKVCLGDLPMSAGGVDPLFSLRPYFMDEYCTGSDPVFPIPLLTKDDFWPDEDGRACTYVNADNCEECFRAIGQECTEANRFYFERMSSYVNSVNRSFVYTGTGGREHREAWVPSGEVPPPRPDMRAVAKDREVEVYWDDRAEHEPDYYRDVIDFESYRIWRVLNWKRPPGVSGEQTPPAQLWSMISEWDIRNFIPAGLAFNVQEQPLGRNTGLEGVQYTPACLDDPDYRGLAEAMAKVVAADTQNDIRVLPYVLQPDGSATPGLEPLIPWAYAKAVLDTFFAVTPRNKAPGIVPKRTTKYYQYTDRGLPNGFRAYHSVTARDHHLTWHEGAWYPDGYGVEIPPEANFASTTPAFAPQTPADREYYGTNIFVYPNPVTREALAEFDQQSPSAANVTGSQIVFANLPAARNLITIYTAAGDLVDTIEHDGTSEGGGAHWNLMSRNGQEIVSGIYLYAVRSDDGRFEDFVGRFVVIW
jgi:hypothetical protein